MVFEHRDYRSILKTTLATKGPGREGYSVRGLAAKLGMSTSFLSEVMSAKKSLSMELAFKVALKLGFTDQEAQYFCLLVQLDQEKDPEFREVLSQRLSDLNPKREAHDLSADLFKSIAEWYHAAILELTYLPGFDLTSENVARELGIGKVEAGLAIDRLVRLELLEQTKRGWKKAHNYVYSEAQIPTKAFRDFHGGLLAQSGEALLFQTPKERMSASDVVAFDTRLLPQVDKLSREFSAAVMKLAEKAKVKDSVYALSVHCFRVSGKGDRS